LELLAEPGDVTIPVFGLTADGEETFLGTGSIIGNGSILLTADHVTRVCSGLLAIYLLSEFANAHDITLIERDPDTISPCGSGWFGSSPRPAQTGPKKMRPPTAMTPACALARLNENDYH
jgi:hypothetical protein